MFGSTVMKRAHVLAAVLAALMFPLAQTAMAAGAGDAAGKADASAGAQVFNQTCVACHGADGKGIMPGMPDFTAPHGVLSLPTTVLEERITDGFSDGKAPMAMPPKGNNDSLTQADVRNVIAYLRSTYLH
jgi:mono/diheme cytochrome c family protein